MPVLSKSDERAAVRYAIDRIDEALAQAWMKEFCSTSGILLHTLRDANNSSWAMQQRIDVATYLRGRGVRHGVIAKLMHRHVDMIKYYVNHALRSRKRLYNKRNTGRWRGGANAQPSF